MRIVILEELVNKLGKSVDFYRRYRGWGKQNQEYSRIIINDFIIRQD